MLDICLSEVPFDLRIEHPKEFLVKLSPLSFLCDVMIRNASVRIHVQGGFFSAKERPSSESIDFLGTHVREAAFL